MSELFPQYERTYTKKELKHLLDALVSCDPMDYKGYQDNILKFLEKCKCNAVVVWAQLFANKQLGEMMFWADPLWLVLYEWDIEKMPELVSKPVYGVVAAWRLELGR